VRKKAGPALQSVIDDPANQAAVRKIISDSTAQRPNVSRIMKATGLSLMAVNGILAKLGYEVAGRRKGGFGDRVRAIILPLHDNQQLTPAEIWRASPELQALLSTQERSEEQNFQVGIARIGSFLRDSSPPRVPWTRQRKRAERRAPLVASNIKAELIAMLKDMQGQRFFGERLYIKIPDIADLSTALRESESLVTEAIDLLLNEANPIIRREGQDIIVPNPIQRRIKSGEISRWEFSVN